MFRILNHKIADYFRRIYGNPALNNSEKETTFFNNFFDENGDWIKNERPQLWDNEEQNLLDDHEFVQVLQVCLNKLPGSSSASINLKFLEQKKRGGNLSGITTKHYQLLAILHRAKLQLRKRLELKWFKK